MNDETEKQPDFYEVIPEYNSGGRICNYHTNGGGERIRVPAGEWERFNLLAGRRHEVAGGVVVYNEKLPVCEPD